MDEMRNRRDLIAIALYGSRLYNCDMVLIEKIGDKCCMNTKSTIIIALALFVSVIVSGVLIAGAIYLNNPEPQIPVQQDTVVVNEEPKTLTVNATGLVDVEPDYVNLNLAFGCEEYSKAKSAINEVNDSIQAAVDALLEYGVLAEDIQTSGTSVYRTYYGTFSADGSLAVKIIGVSSMPDILDAVAGLSNYRHSWYSFEVQDKTKAYEIALENAISEAKFKAVTIAGDMGVTLGDVISLSDAESYGVPLKRNYDSARGDGSVVMIGTTQVMAYINITYELK